MPTPPRNPHQPEARSPVPKLPVWETCRGRALLSLTRSPPTGEHLRICSQGYTCCTSEMEENLANRSRAELETALLDSGRALQATLAAQLRGFDGEWTLGLRTAGRCHSGEQGTHGASAAEERSQGVGLVLWNWGLGFGGVPVAAGCPWAGARAGHP